ncbi:phage tail protein [Pseudomonas sp. MF5691]|uniref:phage tail protein n=1 Tax=Pseudomonas sp. MF5691 TaxID=2797526 RepID=UPI0018E76F0D|nr:phage tail protein [Pseudomonas sp. MF5691]MBJ2292682.1 phage tail protein [Pseudomonas sp. MF5691]
MASWFSEGTVSVQNGSPTVTGVGTKFSNCRSGDMFVGPDQGIYQVINPASDTSLSISPAYRGAAVGGAGYGIVPVNGYPKALADAVNQMVQQWGATLAGLGDVSAQDIVPVTMGGTGATSAPGARTTLGLGTAATLNAGSVTGNLMLIGDRASPLVNNTNTYGNSFQIWNSTETYGAPEAGSFGTIINSAWPGGTYGTQIFMSVTGRMWFRAGDYATAPIREVYHTGNTTRAADGTLKAI